MLRLSARSFVGIAVLTAGSLAGTIALTQPSTSVIAAPNTATAFPDTDNHWAQPFIAKLANRDIVAGYLDGSFRPNQPIGRDEFASFIHNAFNQDIERRIATGSVYNDVPQSYWAAPAIEDAYQMGFMHGYPGGNFRPNQEVTRVEALVALARSLDLGDPAASVSPQPQTTQTTQQTTPSEPDRQQVQRSRTAMMYPMAMTTLMQPFVAARSTPVAPATQPTQASTPAVPAAPAANQDSPQSQRPISEVVSNYYRDADQIPQYAVDAVAQATTAGIVVNYPDSDVLNPNRPATRGEIAALIHQALVNQGKVEPVAAETNAANYIVSAE
ncbi:S-layer homology domain-containing protein [Pantanalinema rosaneae CENA516]|uniref:S-layer homology domain-containing protein n=1 Tax=Pantanalinema rosaneae TaxID=1620701 RepID=UPI003D6F4BCD